MNPTTAQAQNYVDDVATTFEGEIREFVQRDFTSLKRHQTAEAAGHRQRRVRRQQYSVIGATRRRHVPAGNRRPDRRTAKSARLYRERRRTRAARNHRLCAAQSRCSDLDARIISDSMSKWKDALDEAKSA